MIQNNDFRGQRVLVRCDFNVPFKNSEIQEDFRLRASVPTIKYLLNQGADVILISHASESLAPIAKRLSELLECEVSFPEIKGRVSLLENLRLNPGEEANSLEFAQELASLADCYVNDAFSVSHRKHASMALLPQLLPSYVGLSVQKEVAAMKHLRETSGRPLVVIIGGAKVSSKVKAVDFFLDWADHVLLGGKVANAILAAKDISLTGNGIPDEDIDLVKRIELTSIKMHLPVDVVIDDGSYKAPGMIDHGENIFDIGPETAKIYGRIIEEAHSIIWVGPLGFFEKEEYSKGTRDVILAVQKNKRAYKVIGGGDTVLAFNTFGGIDDIDHVSTGGGAMLDFLSGKDMPGLLQ